MRILAISNYYPPLEIGGWEQLTRDVADELSRRGHIVLTLTSRHRAAEASPEKYVRRILHLESPDHTRYHPVYTLRRRHAEAENIRMLTDTVHQFQPDFIFINGMWNLPVSVAQTAEKLLPHRVVYYVASYWAIEPDAHTAFWCDGGSLPKRWLAAIVTRTLARPAPRDALAFEHVLCVSDFMRQKLIHAGAITAGNSRVVFNGIDPDIFTPSTAAPPADTLRLLYAGRLSPDKGVHTAIEALAQLPADVRARVTLSIVGSGTAAYTARLEALRRSSGVADSVTLWGQVPREQMPEILAAHDVLLLLSIWDEPLARMTQEAMAAGLTVIGTPTGGTPEILFDGENGLWVEPDNPAQLAARITFLAKNPDARRKFARAARRTVEEKFTFRRMVDEIETYFAAMQSVGAEKLSTGVSQ